MNNFQEKLSVYWAFSLQAETYKHKATILLNSFSLTYWGTRFESIMQESFGDNMTTILLQEHTELASIRVINSIP